MGAELDVYEHTRVNIGALSLLSRFQEGVASYPVRRVLRSGRGEGGSKSYVRKVWEGEGREDRLIWLKGWPLSSLSLLVLLCSPALGLLQTVSK